MEVVCPEDQVQIPDAIQQPLALLLGNTSPNPDDQAAIILLELRHPPQNTIRLMFWFGPDATRIEEYDVGPTKIPGAFVTVLCQDAQHLIRIMHVHLASKRLEVDVFPVGRHAETLSKSVAPEVNPA